MRRALVLGTGGHARVVLSVLAASGSREVLGFLDLGVPHGGELIMGIPVLGNVAGLDNFRGRSDVDVFLAIGDNEMRRTWWFAVREAGFATPNLISPHAIVDPTAQLGEANVVCARAFIGPAAVIGDNTLLNTACIVEHETSVGSHSHLAPSSTVAGRTRIGECCFIGAGATVIDKVTVVARVIVGAGGTVVHNIDTPGVYIGVPARLHAARVLTA